MASGKRKRVGNPPKERPFRSNQDDICPQCAGGIAPLQPARRLNQAHPLRRVQCQRAAEVIRTVFHLDHHQCLAAAKQNIQLHRAFSGWDGTVTFRQIRQQGETLGPAAAPVRVHALEETGQHGFDSTPGKRLWRVHFARRGALAEPVGAARLGA